MNYSLTWLPDVLLGAGLKVALVPGWQSRGRREMGSVQGVLCHHTAGPTAGNMPTLTTLIEGRSDLAGPLAQLGLGRDGTYYVVAAGLCNHAGPGAWKGITEGNVHLIGIEAENTGLPGDKWPDVQLDAYRRGVAAILRHVGQGADSCVGHKEWAPNRKTDPTFPMDEFRAEVAAWLDGQRQAVLIPSAEPAAAALNDAPRGTLRRGAIGDLVRVVQRACGVPADGVFGGQTEAAVRDLQRKSGLVPDGIVGPKTWSLVDNALHARQP
jgi:peptidoglycan hydrolase-like protein with peptidoglycan-binding domain